MPKLISRGAAAALSAVLLCSPVSAQQPQKDYQPSVGQAGKDVIWVPTPDEVVDRMLTMAQVTPNDYVVDLGAGDGKIAIAAARKFGAKSMGIEYNADMARHAQRNAERAGVQGKAQIVQGDIFASDFSSATVVTMYLLPSLNMKLRPTILAMRPGTRVVSHSFNMEDWTPDETSSINGRQAYLWIVPANVTGRWALEFSGPGASDKLDITLDQRFQKLEGTAILGAIHAGLQDARLRGPNVAFSYVDANRVRREFTGRATGNRLEGSFRADNGAEGRWSAVKK